MHDVFDLEAARVEHPLPAGIDDASLNRAQLARAMNVSETTLAKWIGQGLPCVQEGQNGREYEFRLADAYAWRMWHEAKRQARRDASERATQQMALMFRNDEQSDPDGPVMTAKEIAEEADADYRRQRAAELRGELVRTPRVRELLEDLLVQFRTGMETLPDWCEREFGLSPAQVDKLQARCDALLVESRVRIEQEIVLPAAAGRVVALRGSDQDELGV